MLGIYQDYSSFVKTHCPRFEFRFGYVVTLVRPEAIVHSNFPSPTIPEDSRRFFFSLHLYALSIFL